MNKRSRGKSLAIKHIKEIIKIVLCRARKKYKLNENKRDAAEKIALKDKRKER